jgi:hypothetical protein
VEAAVAESVSTKIGQPASWWHWPLRVALVSRVVASVILFLGTGIRANLPTDQLFAARPWPLNSDAIWYVHIALTGYHQLPQQLSVHGGLYDFAFLPLWPILLWPLTLFSHDPISVAFEGSILADALFCLAALLWYRWARAKIGKTVSRRALLLLCWAPPAVVGSLTYSEPLFLVLTALWFGAWPALDRLRPLWGLAIGLTRISAVALLPAVWRETRSWRARARSAAPILLGLGGWSAAVAFISGRPDGLISAGIPTWLVATGQARGLGGWLANTSPELLANPFSWGWLVLPVLIGIGALAAWRRGWQTEALYAVTLLPLALLGGIWASSERYLWVALPLTAPALLNLRWFREPWIWRLLFLTTLMLWLLFTVSVALGLRDP